MKTKGKSQEKQGISLIVLVITIIVIVILAVTVILSIANNNPIENAKEARFKNDMKTIEEELNMYIAKNYADRQGTSMGVSNLEGETMVSALPSTRNYQDKVKIKDGKLYVIRNNVNKEEKQWASELGIAMQSIRYVLENGKYGVSIVDNVLSTNWYNSETDTSNIPDEIGTDIEIPSGVKTISENTFRKFEELEDIKIPDSVNAIEKNAFSNCSNIRNINLPEGITIINPSFLKCTMLEEIKIPDSVTTISKTSFAECESLKKITLSKNLKTIEFFPFAGCTSLEEIVFSCTAATSIRSNAFAISSLKKLIISANVNSIPDSTFSLVHSTTEVIIEGNARFDDAAITKWGIDPAEVTISGSGYKTT